MSLKIRELKQQRAKLLSDARAIQNRADADKRALTKEERDEQDKLFQALSDIDVTIEREERLADLEKELETPSEDKRANPDSATASSKSEDEERSTAFRNFLNRGLNNCTPQELRVMQAHNATQGGAILAPASFVNKLVEAVAKVLAIRQAATVYTLDNIQGMGVPTLDTDFSAPDWTAEIGTPNEDTGLAFGKRELRPHQLAKRTLVSNTLLQFSALPIDSIIIDRLARQFRYAEENHFINGNGAEQPLGLMTASADGIPTGRDITAGTTTEITFDGLIDSKHALRPEYWPNAAWYFHRDAVKMLRKIKDGEGRYVWEESVRAGEPTTLFGLPVNISDYMPNVFTTGKYVGLVCDMSWYWIADVNQVTIQRLVELNARTNQTEFIGRRWVDGMPVLAEAFTRLKLA